MARPEKVAVVDEIEARLNEADAAVLTEYRGLTVDELATLRAALRPAGADYKVFKNTLARRAVERAGVVDFADLLVGPTALTFVKGDIVGAAKVLRDFSRENPALVIRGGLLGNTVLDAAGVAAIAEVQPREVLLARIAGGFQAPLTKAAGLFQAFTRNMAYGVKALIDQRVAGGEVLEAAVSEPVPPAEAAEAVAEAAAPEGEAVQDMAVEVEASAATAAEEPAEPAAEVTAQVTEVSDDTSEESA